MSWQIDYESTNCQCQKRVRQQDNEMFQLVCAFETSEFFKLNIYTQIETK